MCLAPVVGACAGAAFVTNAAQVGLKPKTQAIKPDPRRINPLSGFKNIFGKNAIFGME
jgi:flagellar biosynthetic protein FlhB